MFRLKFENIVNFNQLIRKDEGKENLVEPRIIIGFGILTLGILILMIEWNKYSGLVYAIFGSLFMYGIWKFAYGVWWSPLPIAIGAYYLWKGLKGPDSSGDNPVKQKWLMTVKGRQTTTMVESTTETLEIGKQDIFGYLPIEIKTVSGDAKLKKGVICKDGRYIEGSLSYGIQPNDDSGETLVEFINVGGFEGVKMQIDDIFTTAVVALAQKYDSDTFIKKTDTVRHELLSLMKDTKAVAAMTADDDVSDAVGLGIKFEKFNPIFTEPESVAKQRKDQAAEELQRQAELTDIETVNLKVEARQQFYNKRLAPGEKHVGIREADLMVYRDGLRKSGKTMRVEGGGSNVNVNKTNRRQKSENAVDANADEE